MKRIFKARHTKFAAMWVALAAILLGVHETRVSPVLKAAETGDASRAKLIQHYGLLPLSFELNVGQASPSVKYLARGGGYSVDLTERGAILRLLKGQAGKSAKSNIEVKALPTPERQALLSLSLVHGKAEPTLRAEQPKNSVSNYFIGDDRSKWRSKVANYGAVRYEQVYPGIDWVIYGNPRRLEYDFIVAPQADPSQIKLQIEGADVLALDDNGNLVVKVGDETLLHLKPVIYQTTANGDKQNIEGHYVFDHQQVAFELGDYDHNRGLVIDPIFAYSTYLGGSAFDSASAIAVDSVGNAYVAGWTASTDFPRVNPVQNVNMAAPSPTAFVAKLNPAGSELVYSTYLGGSGEDSANAIAVDSAGNVYVAGSTYSTNFPTAPNNPLRHPLQAVNAGAKGGFSNAFVTKLNAAGTGLVYSTYLGGSGGDDATAIAIDGAGNAYVAGWTNSTDFPTAPNNPFGQPFQGTTAGAHDAFVAKLNSAGSELVYSTYLGSSVDDAALAIAVDSAGNAYVAGWTNSTNSFPTTINPLQSASAGSQNAFVTKLNPAGTGLVYSTYLGGSGDENANAIAVDSAGNAYVAGWTNSTDFPTGPRSVSERPLQSVNGGAADAFVAKLNAAGTGLVYSTYLGGSGGDQANAIAIDSAGNAYVAGWTYRATSPSLLTRRRLHTMVQGTLSPPSSMPPAASWCIPLT